MKLAIDIPDWAIGGNIFIIGKRELLAYTFSTDKGYTPLKIKTERCNKCGECCENLGSPFSRKMFEGLLKRLQEYDFQEFGRCPLLDDEKGCILGSDIPLGCVISDCSRFDPCSESFEIGGNLYG